MAQLYRAGGLSVAAGTMIRRNALYFGVIAFLASSTDPLIYAAGTALQTLDFRYSTTVMQLPA